MNLKMPRLTNSILLDQFIWMMISGLIAGIVFPFFITILGISAEKVMTPLFFGASILAGLAMGLLNFGLVHFVTRPTLHELGEKMSQVRRRLDQQMSADVNGRMEACMSADDCLVEVNSHDELGQVAGAFNQLVQTLREAFEVQHSYRRFSNAFNSTLELSGLGDAVMEILADSGVAQTMAILVHDESSDDPLRTVYAQGIEHSDRLASNERVIAALEKGRTTTIELPLNVEMDAVLAKVQPRYVDVMPIEFKDVRIGTLVLARLHPLDEKQRTILTLMRQGLGLAVRNALTHEEIQRIAVLDSLTGIYNRRFGMQRMHEEFARAQRMEAPIGLIMIDIDHFKNVNDTYGHQVGDRAIKLVVKLARTVLREGDILVRYGGEEFMIVLPGASSEDAVAVAERLRHKVAESLLKHGQQQIPLTISAGAASYPEVSATDENQLIALADRALYAAKEGGRNRVVDARYLMEGKIAEQNAQQAS